MTLCGSEDSVVPHEISTAVPYINLPSPSVVQELSCGSCPFKINSGRVDFLE